ncbi:hypothetical protein ACFLQJ_02015 [Calditrichota bacterium]
MQENRRADERRGVERRIDQLEAHENWDGIERRLEKRRSKPRRLKDADMKKKLNPERTKLQLARREKERKISKKRNLARQEKINQQNSEDDK